MAVEQQFLAGQIVEGALAGQLAPSLVAPLLQDLPGPAHRLLVGRDLLGHQAQIGRVAVLELIEEGVNRGARCLLRDGLHGGGRGHALVEQFDPQVRLQQLGQLSAELDLGRVGFAIGHEQFVDGVHQLLLAGAVELLEDLETAQLEPAVNELVAVLVVGYGFGEEIGDLQVDGLEDFVEMRSVLGHQLGLGRARPSPPRPLPPGSRPVA